MTTIFAILAILAAAITAAWGVLWAHVRDQGRLPGGVLGNKAKEVGVALFGMPAAGLWLATHGLDQIDAALIWAGMSGAWSLGHMGGLGLRFWSSRKGMSVPAAYAAMAGTGALVTLAPAAALAWSGAWLVAALVLLAGALKVACYEAGYIIRGGASGDWPEPTWIGALLHGATAYAAIGAGIVLAHA
jgi:hypothetical protein